MMKTAQMILKTMNRGEMEEKDEWMQDVNEGLEDGWSR